MKDDALLRDVGRGFLSRRRFYIAFAMLFVLVGILLLGLWLRWF